MSNALFCSTSGPTSAGTAEIRIGVPGGDQIRVGDLKEAGSSYSNTDTKVGRKRAYAKAAASFLTAAVGVASKDGKVSEG